MTSFYDKHKKVFMAFKNAVALIQAQCHVMMLLLQLSKYWTAPSIMRNELLLHYRSEYSTGLL